MDSHCFWPRAHLIPYHTELLYSFSNFLHGLVNFRLQLPIRPHTDRLNQNSVGAPGSRKRCDGLQRNNEVVYRVNPEKLPCLQRWDEHSRVHHNRDHDQ
jgi:hypothetical protein